MTQNPKMLVIILLIELAPPLRKDKPFRKITDDATRLPLAGATVSIKGGLVAVQRTATARSPFPSTGEIYPSSFLHRARCKRGRRAGRRLWPAEHHQGHRVQTARPTGWSRPGYHPPVKDPGYAAQDSNPQQVDRRQVPDHFRGSLSGKGCKVAVYTRPPAGIGQLRHRHPPAVTGPMHPPAPGKTAATPTTTHRRRCYPQHLRVPYGAITIGLSSRARRAYEIKPDDTSR